MSAFLNANTWVISLICGGVTTLWTIYQYRVRQAERRTVQIQDAIAKEHRLTRVEDRTENHESRLSKLETTR